MVGREETEASSPGNVMSLVPKIDEISILISQKDLSSLRRPGYENPLKTIT